MRICTSLCIGVYTIVGSIPFYNENYGILDEARIGSAGVLM